MGWRIYLNPEETSAMLGYRLRLLLNEIEWNRGGGAVGKLKIASVLKEIEKHCINNSTTDFSERIQEDIRGL